MHHSKYIFITSTILATSLLVTMPAHTAESLEQAFMDGNPYIDLRYRYEFIDQKSKADNAHASTLRTRLGYESGSFHGFSGVLEFENVTQIGSDNYNDTLNGRTDHPTVADPETTEVNQVFLQYTGLPDTQLRVGRERINIDNQRFIGSVGWRQNDQTFDAFTAVNQSIQDTKITYGYLHGINRIFGNDSPAGDWDSNSHIVNISNTSTPLGKITGYGYFLDFESDAPAVSNKTFGLSINGKVPLSEEVKFKYHAEYAMQSDYGDNPTNYDTNYYHLAPAIQWKGLTATLGYEILGSDNGTIGFSTPLATLHKFNGLSDKFLSTPATGIDDRYLELKYTFSEMDEDWSFLGGVLLKSQYHVFSSEEGNTDFGSEFNLYAKKTFGKNYFVEAKYVDYNADTVSSDTQKFVLGMGVKF